MEIESNEVIDEGEYIVERIINHKFINGKCYYLLKWKDFDERDNTWEEESSLDCPDLLEEYQDLNVERIEHDRIISQNLEKKKKEKIKKEMELLKNLIDNNFSLYPKNKSADDLKNNENLHFHKEVEQRKNFLEDQKIGRKENIQKENININPEHSIEINLDLDSEKSTYPSLPKTPKLPNSELITIIGYKKDIDGRLLFSVVENDGKIKEFSKQELIEKDSSLYLKFLEESFILKSI